jgi:hypothetical protein
MSLEPKVEFWDRKSDVNLTGSQWNVGTVKAGETSETLELRIWNNKGGSQLCAMMQEVDLFILDGNNQKVQPIVKDGWLFGKCVSLNPSGTAIALNDVNKLAIGSSSFPSLRQIDGAINDGLNTAVGNYTDIDLFFSIPAATPTSGVTHGDKAFSIAVQYFFV